jgi:hypothetical protein
MNTRARRTLGLVLLLVGALAFGAAAQQGHGNDPQQGQQPPKLDIAGAAQILRVTEAELLAALGLPEGWTGGPPQGGPGEHQQPDLAAAAAKLGISEDALKDALGDPQQGPPDSAAAAATLGISEEALIEALGLPEGGPGGPGERMGPGPGPNCPKPIDFAATAKVLGRTEAELLAALGLPESGPPQGAPGGP